MNGELGPRSSLPPPGTVDQPPARPPCADLFASTFDLSDPEEIGKRLDKATSLAINAKPLSQCRKCLEPDGLIRCPIKFREDNQPTEEVDVSITKTSSRSIVPADIISLQLPEMAVVRERLLRRLKNHNVPVIPIPDGILRDGLNEICFAQPKVKFNDVEEPSIPVKEPPSTESVPDPRPAEGKEMETLKEERQDRPRCARTLSRFLVERHAAEKRWKAKNIGKSHNEIKPFRHQASLELYKAAILAVEDADPEKDCPNCLQEYCPVKNGADGAEFYRVTTQKVEISGQQIKTRPRFVNRLDGLPIDKMAGPPDPKKVKALMDDQMKSLTNNLAA